MYVFLYFSLSSQQWYRGLFWPVSIASASSQPLSLSVQMSLLPSDEAAVMSLYVNGPETLASLKSLVTCTRSDSQVWTEKTGGEKEEGHTWDGRPHWHIICNKTWQWQQWLCGRGPARLFFTPSAHTLVYGSTSHDLPRVWDQEVSVWW